MSHWLIDESMWATSAVWVVAAATAAWLLTGQVRRWAIARGTLDLPNERSSHVIPTPRGGGVAFAIVVTGIAFALAFLRSDQVMALIAAGGLAIAVLGYADDVYSLRVLPRLIVHFAAAICVVAVFVIQSDQPLLVDVPAFLIAVVLAVGIVWSINLFNFMDGIDGIAASQAIFGGAASVLLSTYTPDSMPWIIIALVLAGACVGFLIWNWPPAKIFMGDVGSGFLGFWMAALAIALHTSGALSIWASVVLNAMFVADATSTLICRVLRRERWHAPHRSHVYQRLSRKFGSHMVVTSGLWLLNVFLILPLAYVTEKVESGAPAAAATTLIVLSVGCVLLGAGRPDQS